MVKSAFKALTIAMGLFFSITSAQAADEPKQVKIQVVTSSKSTVVNEQDTTVQTLTTQTLVERESLFPQSSRDLSMSHFTWGAEAGASLDMTSHDFSTFDIDVLLGYKNSIFNLVGAGAGIHRSIHKGNNFIPVYAVIRTDFRKQRSPLFLDLKAGYSFSTIDDAGVGDFYGSLGMGINLQQSRKASSYVILAAKYRYLSNSSRRKIDIDSNSVIYARLLFGVNF